MATYTVYSTTADGLLESNHGTYSTARAGANLAANTTGTIQANGQREFFNYRIYEFFVGFDTSAIPDGATVSSATVSLYGQSDSSSTDFTSQARLKDWGGTLTTADYVAGADLSSLTLLATHATSGGWSTSAYNDYTSDANFPSNVSKTGTTYIMFSSDRTSAGTSPSIAGSEFVDAYTADDSGTTRDPKLVVVDDTGTDQEPSLVGGKLVFNSLLLKHMVGSR